MAPSKTFIPSEYIRTYVCVPKLLYENLTSQEGERTENPEFKDSSKDLLYENTRRTNIGLDRIRRQNEARKDGEAENDEEEKEKEEEKLGFDQKIKESGTSMAVINEPKGTEFQPRCGKPSPLASLALDAPKKVKPDREGLVR